MESPPLIYATEGFAYASSSANEAHLKSIRDVIEVLMGAGADINAQDGRGLMGMIYLLNYGADGKVDELIKMYLSRTPNFEIAGHDDGIAPIHFFVRTRQAYDWVLQEVLKDPAKYKINFMARSVQKNNLFHWAATRSRFTNGTLRIQSLAEYLPVETTRALIDSPDETNAAPLIWAISTKTKDAVEYLLNNYSVNVNRITTEGETPLDIAERLGANEIATLLRNKGAVRSQPLTEITCEDANSSPMSFEKLKAILAKCQAKIKKVEDLLPLIPKTMRSRYALMYASRSSQPGSFDYPRALLFERTGQFIMTFNGHSDFDGYQNLEMMTLNPTTRKIELYNLDMQKVAQGNITPEGPNPSRCLRCHGETPHPNWDVWTGWSGAYFGDMLNLYPEEKKRYDKFAATLSSHSRYKYLLPPTLQPMDLEWGVDDFILPGVSYNFLLAKMDGVVHALNGPRIAAEVSENVRLKPYRYALLGALSCAGPVENFLPTDHQMPFSRTRTEIEAQLKQEAMTHARTFDSFQNIALPGGFAGRYNLEYSTGYVTNPDIYLRQLENLRTPNVMYIMEGSSGRNAMNEWSHYFAPRKNHIFGNLGHVESFAWKTLLSPTEDAELWALYQAAFSRLKGKDRLFGFLYKSGHADAPIVCEKLKVKSLAELSRQ
ncbi:MAG: ankyrin repeat domain-containing protein [Bdellovibrionales bacterium]